MTTEMRRFEIYENLQKFTTPGNILSLSNDYKCQTFLRSVYFGRHVGVQSLVFTNIHALRIQFRLNKDTRVNS